MSKARTRLIVLNQFQKWFVFNFIVYTALFLAVFGVGLFAWFKVLAQGLVQVASLLSQTFMDLIEKNIFYGILFSGGLVLVLLIIAAWQSLIFSRKIAGPIFALARHLENCERDGKLSHLNLRKDDLFLEMAQKFNALADKINEEKGSR